MSIIEENSTKNAKHLPNIIVDILIIINEYYIVVIWKGNILQTRSVNSKYHNKKLVINQLLLVITNKNNCKLYTYKK